MRPGSRNQGRDETRLSDARREGRARRDRQTSESAFARLPGAESPVAFRPRYESEDAAALRLRANAKGQNAT